MSDKRRIFTMDDVTRIAQLAVGRAIVGHGIHEFPHPEGLGVEQQGDGGATGSGDDYSYDTLSFEKIQAAFLGGQAFTYKTAQPARSCDFYLNAPWMFSASRNVDSGAAANGDYARVELYALHGSTRSLITVGSMTGCPNLHKPAGPVGKGAVTPIGQLMAAGRVSKPAQWEAVLYFGMPSPRPTVGGEGNPTNVAMVTDEKMLPPGPPTLGSLSIFGTVPQWRTPSPTSPYAGGIAPPFLVAIQARNQVPAPRYLQFRTVPNINAPCDYEVALPAVTTGDMVRIAARDLESLFLEASSSGVLLINVSTTSGVGTYVGVATGDVWWQVTSK